MNGCNSSHSSSCSSATSLLAQQQQGVFRAGVITVPIYTTVTDKTGRLVPDLEEQHFEIYDNEKLQKTAFFRSDIQPVSVVIALDMSGSMIMNIELAKNRRRGVRPAPAAARSGAHRLVRRQGQP